jgi:hypothetical protein
VVNDVSNSAIAAQASSLLIYNRLREQVVEKFRSLKAVSFILCMAHDVVQSS